MAESPCSSEKPLTVLKCTLLTPSKVPPEELEGIGGKLKACINCIVNPLENIRDWSNRYWLKYDWDNPLLATPIPVRYCSQETPVPSFADFSASVEQTRDRICLFIGPHPQLPIHDSLLINSSGLYVVCCCEDDGKEARESYLVRILDAILAVSTTQEKSVVCLHKVDIDSLCSKYTKSSKLCIVPIDRQNLLKLFEDVASDVMQDLILQKLDLEFLTESDSIILCGAANEARLEDATLKTLHDLGIIFRQQLGTDARGLTFVKPNVLHKLLHRASELGPTSITSIVTNLYGTLRNELHLCKMSEHDRHELNKNRKVILTKLLHNLQLVVEIETDESILLSSIKACIPENRLVSVSVEPLWIKLDSEMSEFDFQHLITELYKQICKKFRSRRLLRNLGFARITGLGYRVSFCRHNDRLIVVNFFCKYSDSEQTLTLERQLSLLRKCQDILHITRDSLDEKKYGPDLGFRCRHKANCECDKFASWNSSERILFCESQGTPLCMKMSQCIWFQHHPEQLKDHYIVESDLSGDCAFFKVKDEECACRGFATEGISTYHSDPTAPRAGMDDKIDRSLDILKVPVCRKGLIDNLKCLGAVLDIEQQANAIMHSNGSIDGHLLEILNLYIREKCPTWRDLCTALKDLPCFNNVREKIEEDHS